MSLSSGKLVKITPNLIVNTSEIKYVTIRSGLHFWRVEIVLKSFFPDKETATADLFSSIPLLKHNQITIGNYDTEQEAQECIDNLYNLIKSD